MTKPSVLGDCLYVVESDDSVSRVYKVIKDINARPDPYEVDDEGICSCKAGQHGRECKHSKMVDRSLRGQSVPWDEALKLTKLHAKKMTQEWEDADAQALMELKEPEEAVDISHVLVYGGLSEGRERLTIWTEVGFENEHGPLLMVIHAFGDRGRYEKALRAAKKKAMSRRSGKT